MSLQIREYNANRDPCPCCRKLTEWLASLPLRPTQDLVRELHGRLEGLMPGYRFPDLLAALNRIANSPPADMHVITTNRFSLLQPGGKDAQQDQQFVYFLRRLQPNTEIRHD